MEENQYDAERTDISDAELVESENASAQSAAVGQFVLDN